MSESFSVSIRVVSSFILGEAPRRYLPLGGFFLPSGVSPSFLWSGQRKEAKETPQPQAGRTLEACFVLPPSLRSVVRSPGRAALCFEVARPGELYRWTLGWRSPTEQGLSQHPPESSPRGTFFCGRKPPLPPKKPLRISPQLITLG